MRKIIPLLGALGLIGCSYFSPDYHKPDTKVPAKWSSQNSNVESISESLPYLAWWQKFNDPVLNQYIESGLNNNLTIEAAKANLEAAQGQLTTVKLNWLPTMNIIGGAIGGNSQNSLTPIGNLGVVGNSGAFFALIPQYTLNVFTNYTLQKQAGYNVEAAKNAVLSVRLAVIGQVSNAYFVYLAQLQILDQFKQLNQNLTELITITRAMNQRGMGNDIVLNELLSKQQLVAGQIELVQKNLIAAQNALRYLINETPGSAVAGRKFAAINPLQIIPGNLPVSVLAARPDVIAAEWQLKAANEGISVSSSALLPGVNLNYFYAQGSGTQAFNNPVPGVNINNTNTQNYGAAYANWIIAPGVFGAIDTSTAVFKGALANYEKVVNSALHEVDNALAANNGYNRKMVSDNNAYQSLESAIDLHQAMAARGLEPYTLVLGARIEQNLLSIIMTETKLQQMVSLVTLYQSLGGGYQHNNESQ